MSSGIMGQELGTERSAEINSATVQKHVLLEASGVG